MQPSTSITVRDDVYYYNADSELTSRAGNIELDTELTLLINLTTVLYTPELKIFGAQYGAGIVVPISHTKLDTNINSLRVEDDVTDLGDITFVPAMFFWNRGNFHFSLGEYIVTPTGQYDINKNINPSLNYWSFDTNFSATYLNLETGQDYSFNLGYIYNTENEETNYQTGEEVHLDYMFNQFLSDTFAIGVHGFYIKQITGDSGEGAVLGGFKGRAAGVGPAVLWMPTIKGQMISIIAKWLNEYKAENRLEGDHIFLSAAMSF
ncbi:SphA family protein [Thalassotalea sp. ND16A]|uniref:SphA family protein n=1 Tax=Thalassotalea sp. ND16A TaxID=1535422 RepID=UPI00051A4447|nr:transporter [Thalassotalea sp. ND16A]KGJ98432.1 hypothetical protein ND16A_0741 [Thalassotalea sp. ND16A]